MRKSGILMPVASLPGKYGIGTLGETAYRFVDSLKAAGQSYWQILPLGPTSYGDSPYQSFSTFAGNPYFIDLEILIKKGWLTKNECDACDFGKSKSVIDYGKLYNSRFTLLKKAFGRSKIAQDKAYIKFCAANTMWLDDYALFMAVKNKFNGVSFIEWDEDIRTRKPEALKRYQTECAVPRIAREKSSVPRTMTRLRPNRSAARPETISDSPKTAEKTEPTVPSCVSVTPSEAKSSLICGSAAP